MIMHSRRYNEIRDHEHPKKKMSPIIILILEKVKK